MPHDRPSLRCTLSDWCEQPRWRGQKPWTVGELRHTPGRRTIQIHQTRSQVVLVSGGVVQSQQHNNSLSPACTALGGEQNITGKSTVRASRATRQDGTAWMFKSYDSLVSMDAGRGEKRVSWQDPPARRCRMPVAMVGYKLRQMQAQSPITAPKHIKPRLTKGKRNWQRQRSDFEKEKKRNVTMISDGVLTMSISVIY